MIQLDDDILAVLNGNANMEHFFLYLLLESDDGVLQKSYAEIENDTGLSVQVIRKCLEKFKQVQICLTDTSKVTRRGKTRNVLQITVCDIEKYTTSKKGKKQARSKEETKTEQPKTAVTLADKQADMEERKRNFGMTLQPYSQQYGREMLTEFYRYWTEPNKSGTKMRFELERTWSLAGRLATWAGNQRVFNKDKQTYNGSGSTTTERLNDAASLIMQLRQEGVESSD
jgi:hypothetical protein